MIKFRCSNLFKIMKDNDTRNRYLSEVYVTENTGIQFNIESKYLTKGTEVEDNSIKLAKKYLFPEPKNLIEFRRLKSFEKNKNLYSNEWIKGTPDVFFENKIIDIKSSWSAATFIHSVASMRKNRKCIEAYYWQLQGYMMLTGAQESSLIYCLVNTPNHLIEGEKRKLKYSMGIWEGSEFERFNLYNEACGLIEMQHNYDNFELTNRVFEFKVQRNDLDIEKIKEAVLYSRKYIKKWIENEKGIKNEHLENWQIENF